MRQRAIFLLALLVALFLAGCGGGGGGGGASSDAMLAYTTDWTNADANGQITGESQVVSLFNRNGIKVASNILNRTTDLQTVSFKGIPAGPYRLLVQLYSSTNGNGILNGTIEAPLQIVRGSTFKTVVGGEIRQIKVLGDETTLQVPEAKRYFAVAYTTGGEATFSRPSDFEWSILGNVATVDDNGLVSAKAAGNGSVRAQHVPTALSATAAVTVETATKTTTKWSVFVFMNAANDLSAFDMLNINQMERVATNPNVRFVVQWKQAPISADPNPEFVGTRRYLVRPDQTDQVGSKLIQDLGTGIDMGSPQTLSEFISWAKTYYPAERYCLIIWNHGNGWRRGVEEAIPTRGVSYDDETLNHIETWELAQAIGGTKWDILSWDASLMQMMEVAYEVKDVAKFVVGSEESPPGEGLPYNLVFQRFRDNPNETTANLTKAFVDAMLEAPGYTNRKITQSSIDTSKLVALRNALDNLAAVLIQSREDIKDVIPQVRASTQSYSLTTTRQYYDIGDLCDEIDARINIPQITTATQMVRSALDQAVVWEGHNQQSPNSHGLSIDFSDAQTFNSHSKEHYIKLRFAMESLWDEWLTVAP